MGNRNKILLAKSPYGQSDFLEVFFGNSKSCEDVGSMQLSLSKFKWLFNLGYLFLLFTVLFYFVFKVAYIALSLKMHVSPDEMFHLRFIKAFAEISGLQIPLDPSYVTTGPIQYFPYLYHLIIGKIFAFLPLPLGDVVYVRLLNIPLALGNLLFFYLITVQVLPNRLMRAFALVVHTNIIMFTFLSASANYDNLANLFATFAIYQFVMWFQQRKLKQVLFMVSGLLAGMLVKYSMIPLLGLLVLAVIFEYVRTHWIRFKLRKLPPLFLKRDRTFMTLFSFLLFTGLVAANLSLYGGNLLKQGRLLPSCAKTYSPSLCKKHNWPYKNSVRDKKIFKTPKPMVDFDKYFVEWYSLMVKRTFGILGHKIYHPTTQVYTFGKLVITLLFLSIFLFYTPKDRLMNTLTVVMLAYLAVLCLAVNYKAYRITGVVHLAVHGRYTFPILSIAIAAFCHYVFKPFPGKWQIVLVLLFSYYFVAMEFPAFLQNRASKKMLTDAVKIMKKKLPKNRNMALIPKEVIKFKGGPTLFLPTHRQLN